jgi:hypothetical protein
MPMAAAALMNMRRERQLEPRNSELRYVRCLVLNRPGRISVRASDRESNESAPDGQHKQGPMREPGAAKDDG